MKSKMAIGVLHYIDVRNSIALVRVGARTYFCDLNSNPQLRKLSMFPDIEVSIDLQTGQGVVVDPRRTTSNPMTFLVTPEAA